MIENFENKLAAFAQLLEAEQLRGLIRSGCDCEANRNHAKIHTHIGGKYARVDTGTSGKYMVVLATGEIFGIKAYGVIHRGHQYGTLDTTADYDWSNYRAFKKSPAYVAGGAAFADGQTRVAGQDPLVNKLIAEIPAAVLGAKRSRAACEIMNDWYAGWDTANLSAPVVSQN